MTNDDLKVLAEFIGGTYIDGMLSRCEQTKLRDDLYGTTLSSQSWQPHKNISDAFMLVDRLVELKIVDVWVFSWRRDPVEGMDQFEFSGFKEDEQYGFDAVLGGGNTEEQAICNAVLKYIKEGEGKQ